MNAKERKDVGLEDKPGQKQDPDNQLTPALVPDAILLTAYNMPMWWSPLSK